MPRRKPPTAARSKSSGDGGPAAVSDFMGSLKHPLKPDIEAVRRLILDVSPEIGEGIKWNGPSFRTKDYFATVFLRSTDSVRLILHQGAKVKDNAKEVKIDDARGLIKWLAPNRCMVTLGTGKEIAANARALQAIIRQWIAQL